MRYYKIDITSDSGQVLYPGSLGAPITSLAADGVLTNPAALNVEFDIPVTAFHAPDGEALVRIWGLGLQDLGASFNLNPTGTSQGANIAVYGGMAKGLPLANPAQQGLLVKGRVLHSFGNWIGTAQTVDIVMAPGAVGSDPKPVNYSLDWKAGTSLSDALQKTLSTAIPNATIKMQISPRLTLNYDQQGFYGSLTQLNSFLNPLSQSIITDQGYQGVSISYDGQTVTAFDGTQPSSNTVAIQFQDLIGQPTWIDVNTIQVKCAMRGDLDIFQMVTLPQSLATGSSTAYLGLSGNTPSNTLTFSGTYQITKIHHYGNYRQADASSWNTTIDMIKPPSSVTATSGGP